MRTILASAAVAAVVLGTAVPASAQFYSERYEASPFYGPGPYWGGPQWGGPRVYVAPPAYGVVPAYRYHYGPGWGRHYWSDWD